MSLRDTKEFLCAPLWDPLCPSVVKHQRRDHPEHHAKCTPVFLWSGPENDNVFHAGRCHGFRYSRLSSFVVSLSLVTIRCFGS
jgi:hypothetical protein